MKRIIFLFLTSSLFILPLLIVKIEAITPGRIPTSEQIGVESSPITTTQQILTKIADVVRLVYIIFFIIAVLFILFAAYTYLTGSDNPDKIETAHKQLIYAAIAIAIALMAVGVTAIIKNFLGDGMAEGYRKIPSYEQSPHKFKYNPETKQFEREQQPSFRYNPETKQFEREQQPSPYKLMY